MAKVAEYPGQPSEVEVFRDVLLATFVCSGISFHLLLDERINFVRVLHVTQMGFANFLVWLRSNKRQVISQSFLPFFLLCNTLTYSTPFIASKLWRKSFFISFRRVINSKYFFRFSEIGFVFTHSATLLFFPGARNWWFRKSHQQLNDLWSVGRFSYHQWRSWIYFLISFINFSLLPPTPAG